MITPTPERCLAAKGKWLRKFDKYRENWLRLKRNNEEKAADRVYQKMVTALECASHLHKKAEELAH